MSLGPRRRLHSLNSQHSNIVVMQNKSTNIWPSSISTEGEVRYRRQFLLTDAELPIPAEWKTLEVGRGMYLYHCPDLKVCQFIDKLGNQWHLIGHAYSVIGNDSELLAREIATSAEDSIHTIVRNWTGRWLLISPNSIVTDAAGLLGVFILEQEKSIMLSSSLALLKALRNPPLSDTRVISWHGFNWYPLPATKYQSIRKLLPDQAYFLSSRRIVFLDRLELPSITNTKEIAACIIRGLTNVVRQIHRSRNDCRIVLSLTAGLDSRTNYAILRSACTPFSAMTIWHPRISLADRCIPEAIVERHGIQHRFIKGSAYSDARRQQYDQHTDATVIDGDRYFYSHGAFESLGADYLVRSGCWEIGRKYFHRQLAGLDLQEIHDRPEKLLKRFRTYCNTRESGLGVRNWAAWRLQHMQPAADWRDLFYRDQRLAGWLSSIEQSLDLIAPASIHPVNSDYFYGFLIRASEHEAETGIQEAIIDLCAPDLGDIPINPDLDGTLRRTRAFASRVSAIFTGELHNLVKQVVSGQRHISHE